MAERDEGKSPEHPHKVVWHPDAREERNKLDTSDQSAIRNVTDKLRALGDSLPHPHQSAVQQKAGKGLRELRPTRGSSTARPLYRRLRKGARGAEDTFVVYGVAPEAMVDEPGFNQAVQRAQIRRNQIEAQEERRVKAAAKRGNPSASKRQGKRPKR